MMKIPAAVVEEHLVGTVQSLLLKPNELADPKVRDFLVLSLRTGAEEKTSNPNDWTPDEQAAFDGGNWRLFSQLRGYSADEIETFARYLDCVAAVDQAHGDPADPYLFPQAISHELWKSVQELAAAVFPEEPWETVEKLVYAACADNMSAAFDRVARLH